MSQDNKNDTIDAKSFTQLLSLSLITIIDIIIGIMMINCLSDRVIQTAAGLQPFSITLLIPALQLLKGGTVIIEFICCVLIQ